MGCCLSRCGRAGSRAEQPVAVERGRQVRSPGALRGASEAAAPARRGQLRSAGRYPRLKGGLVSKRGSTGTIHVVPMEDCTMPFQYALGQAFPAGDTTNTSESALEAVLEGKIGSVLHMQRFDDGGGLLKQVALPWSSPLPISRAVLERKRTEFWETVPSYGGSPDVWGTLRSAIQVSAEPDGLATARAILSCAAITTPSGFISECYDERGFKYVVPTFCLCDPEGGLVEAEGPLAGSMAASREASGACLATLDVALPLAPLTVRLSNGDNVAVSLPRSREACIGHLRGAIFADGAGLPPGVTRIEFFWAGHGPLSEGTLLLRLGDPLQVDRVCGASSSRRSSIGSGDSLHQPASPLVGEGGVAAPSQAVLIQGWLFFAPPQAGGPS